jgi:hypothetical protein
VQLSASAADARVELRRGWRSAVGPDLLAVVVLEAFRAASLARLESWAADHAAPGALRAAGAAAVPTVRPARSGPPTREALTELGRAWRDVREFSLQLTALMRTPQTVSGQGREVRVETLGGQIVDLVLDPAWRRTATDPDLERRIASALRAALQQCAALPTQALKGCPDLVAVLARNPAGSPVPLHAESPADSPADSPGGR